MNDECWRRTATTEGSFIAATEAVLVAAAKRGDGVAYAELARRHSFQVLRSIQRIVRNQPDAEDVLQDCLMKAYKSLPDFKEQSAFSTWLTRIGINCALMLLRRQRTRAHGHLMLTNGQEEEWLENVVERSPSPEDLVARAESAQVLRRAINLLPTSLRDVISARYETDASSKEIALTLGMSEAAVKARLYRARSRLRQAFVERSLAGRHLVYDIRRGNIARASASSSTRHSVGV